LTGYWAAALFSFLSGTAHRLPVFMIVRADDGTQSERYNQFAFFNFM
jgi:hypothetical protein